MTVEEALEALFAMASVQDGYAKKAADPGLKLIHKANAKAQREVAITIKDLRARLAESERQVKALRLQLDQKDALYDSGFQAGVKLGWNFGILGDEAGFQAATSSTEHVAELKRIRAEAAALAAAEEPKP